jgi:4-amino-4-deoxy-L-arabinose transferase-like glycosyltransferase
VSRRWAVTLATAALYLLGAWAVEGVTGLVRTVVANTPERDELDVRRVQAIDVHGLDAASGGTAGVIAIWQGVWEVPAAGLYDLALGSHGRSWWTIDDSLANEAVSLDAGGVRRTVWLAAGFHRIEIRYDVDASAPRLIALVARAGQRLEPLARAALKPRPPRNPRVRGMARELHHLLGWLTLVTVVLAIRTSIPTLSDRWHRWFAGLAAGRSAGVRHWRAWVGRGLAWTALACILVHGALLRIDAITGRYGPAAPSSLPGLSSVQMRSFAKPEAIRPASITWQMEPMFPHRDGKASHYRSDPYTYLEAARNMSSFYDAHFREPVFPFATKVFLRLLDGQDVAVSFTSAFFSVVAIGLTYLLGAAIWSRSVGLLAALGLSLNSEVISLASSGWRDDAYMAAVTLCAYLMLRWWRTEPAGARVYRLGRLGIDSAYVSAAVAGVAGGLAILTRIMALSFLAAAAFYIVFARSVGWRRHLGPAGLAIALAALVAGPYFVNCWRVYGDPFYTFNVHGEIYSGAEGQAAWKGSTAAYVSQKIARRPFEMLDTVAQGLTTYPFANKWYGLDPWFDGLGQWASMAAIAGLAVLAASGQGRLLLVVMVSSLVPFSFTWPVDPDFRFTVHVYPILLIAAAVALGAGVRGIRAVLIAGHGRADAAWQGRTWVGWACAVGMALAVLWFVTRVSPPLVFAEALRVREDATVMAGARDGVSFERGWSRPLRSGNVTMRVAREEGALSIPLPGEGDYPATLRMDPFPRPLASTPGRLPLVEVVLNGMSVATIALQWSPGRVGAYNIVLPRAAVRRGANHLVLRVTRPAESATATIRPGLTAGDAVGLWYVRVHPPARLLDALQRLRDEQTVAHQAVDHDILAVERLQCLVAHGRSVVSPEQQTLAVGGHEKGLVLPGTFRISAVGSDLDPALDPHDPIVDPVSGSAGRSPRAGR